MCDGYKAFTYQYRYEIDTALAVLVMVLFAGFLFGIGAGIHEYDCKPDSIGGYAVLTYPLGCELAYPRFK